MLRRELGLCTAHPVFVFDAIHCVSRRGGEARILEGGGHRTRDIGTGGEKCGYTRTGPSRRDGPTGFIEYGTLLWRSGIGIGDIDAQRTHVHQSV
jgi:hypothetical protein